MVTLITGGAGFIGSHVARYLRTRGDEVVILDNFNDYYDPQIKRNNAQQLSQTGVVVVEGDVRDLVFLQHTFRAHSIERVIHLAAMAGVRNSATQTALYAQVNYIGSMNVLEVACQQGVDQFVLASTSSVYGATTPVPFREDAAADHPLASYPATKRGAEMLAHSYHNLFALPVTVLRFFNVYGPAGRPDMMPARLFRAAQSGEVVPVFNHGDIYRDWTYIDDTVLGVVKALDTPLGYEILNLGVGSPIALAEFITIIESLTGQTIRKHYVDTPASDPPITYSDSTRIRQLLGYAPAIEIREGLQRTWEWLRSN
jgi:UDP-glucuronate 4-epimerase